MIALDLAVPSRVPRTARDCHPLSRLALDTPDRLNPLHRERADLKLANRFPEMVAVQRAIIAEAEAANRVEDLANAWNYLSCIYRKLGIHAETELAARKAIGIYAAVPAPSFEALACYEFMLANILADQRKFTEAVPLAEAAVSHYAVFHNPPDEYLRDREREAGLIRRKMDQETGGSPTAR